MGYGNGRRKERERNEGCEDDMIPNNYERYEHREPNAL